MNLFWRFTFFLFSFSFSVFFYLFYFLIYIQFNAYCVGLLLEVKKLFVCLIIIGMIWKIRVLSESNIMLFIFILSILLRFYHRYASTSHLSLLFSHFLALFPSLYLFVCFRSTYKPFLILFLPRLDAIYTTTTFIM